MDIHTNRKLLLVFIKKNLLLDQMKGQRKRKPSFFNTMVMQPLIRNPTIRTSLLRDPDLFRVTPPLFLGCLRQQLASSRNSDQDLTKGNRGCIWQLQLQLPHPLPISGSSCAYANQISTSARNNRQCNTCEGNCDPLEK